jgi:uncharacterized protein (UPF0297 family)
MSIITNFNESEYLLFLLIYASHVDFKFSEKEQQSLKNLFPDIYSKVERKFYELNEAEQVVLLTQGMLEPSYKDRVDNFEKLMQKQFWVNGKFCDFEKAFLKFYKQLSAAV